MAARAEAAEATRARILDAAQDLFGELAFDLVSLGAVAERAGVTAQTVIRRFGTKERLFAAAAARRSVQIRAERDEASPADAKAAIANLVESYERWGDEQLHLLSQERRAEPIRETVQSGRAYHQAWVERIFAAELSNLTARARRRRRAELVAITDLHVWKTLRRDLGLTRHETETAVQELVGAIVEVS